MLRKTCCSLNQGQGPETRQEYEDSKTGGPGAEGTLPESRATTAQHTDTLQAAAWVRTGHACEMQSHRKLCVAHAC